MAIGLMVEQPELLTNNVREWVDGLDDWIPLKSLVGGGQEWTAWPMVRDLRVAMERAGMEVTDVVAATKSERAAPPRTSPAPRRDGSGGTDACFRFSRYRRSSASVS